MLENLDNVPASACLGAENMPISDYIGALGGDWFSSEPALLTQEDGAVTALTSRSSAASARKAKGNNGPCVLKELAGQPFLTFKNRKNCGFVTDPVEGQSCLSLAILFGRAKPRSGTLAAVLNQKDGETLVIRENEENLQIASRAGQPSINLPFTRRTKTQLLFLRFDNAGAKVAFAADEPMQLDWETSAFPGKCTPLIGCRRDQVGLYKTQGPNQIADFLLLPDIDIFAGQSDLLRRRLMQYRTEVFDDGL